MITENTAKLYGGSYMPVKYTEIIEPQKVETRTEQEIISDIRNGLSQL
jgi:hypothetical protein